ncbi:hypothetical protein LOAG_13808 [Loa loa]|uniref:Uncharacterized protein n=1 Tax=Loa loa TaxID=7209 RepID=A0A1S0TIX5_LOALO|nr:hypothetical protein LOAG_13808 [Loa loa]EFO14708.1 hypothetical protein LOAG_13808 [Loa loa]
MLPEWNIVLIIIAKLFVILIPVISLNPIDNISNISVINDKNIIAELLQQTIITNTLPSSPLPITTITTTTDITTTTTTTTITTATTTIITYNTIGLIKNKSMTQHNTINPLLQATTTNQIIVQTIKEVLIF